MNTTGCAAAFARDSTLILDGIHIETACFLAMPFYFLMLVLFSIILGLVATIRTMLVCSRKRRQTYHSILSPLVPMVIVCASWISFFVMLLLIVMPATFGTGGNVMIFLIGMEYLCFNILSERWLRKLIRLGSKIISNPKRPGAGAAASDSSAQSAEELKMLEYLNKSDRVLKILDSFIIVGITIQAICLCILCMVFTENPVWLRIGIGMEGFNVFCPMCALIWQYQRCTSAITSSMREVKSFQTPAKPGLQNVQLKFRRHQLILACSGIPASLLYVLWGADVIPISYLVIVITAFFDSVVNGGVLVTFVRRAKTRAAGTLTTNIMSGSYIRGDNTSKAFEVSTFQPS